MKKKLIIVVIICLMLFLFRDYIIKYYFISKIEYVDYDEYILIDYLNGKKNKATYVGADSMVVLGYNEKEEVECVWTYDYNKKMFYQYNLKTGNVDKNANNEDRLMNLNNEYLIKLLKSNTKFNYKGIKEIDGSKCYVLEFVLVKENIVTIYLDKELLYTLNFDEQFFSSAKDKNLIHKYELDLELKHKDLFKDYIN